MVESHGGDVEVVPRQQLHLVHRDAEAFPLVDRHGRNADPAVDALIERQRMVLLAEAVAPPSLGDAVVGVQAEAPLVGIGQRLQR